MQRIEPPCPSAPTARAREMPELFGDDIRSAFEDPHAALAAASALYPDGEVLRLPFCPCLEASLCGADLLPASTIDGIRPGKIPYTSIEEVLDAIEAARARMLSEDALAAALAPALSQKQSTSVWDVSGPMSPLSALLGTDAALRLPIRQPESFVQFLAAYRRLISDILIRVRDAGIHWISLADPSGSLSIIGPRPTRLILESFYLPLWEAFTPSMRFLLCPKLTASIERIASTTRVKSPPLRGVYAVTCPARLDPRVGPLPPLEVSLES